MKKEAVLIVLLFAILISGCKNNISESQIVEPDEQDQLIEDNIVEKNENLEGNALQWVYKGSAIEGNYADSDFVDLGNGKYRMYYATEPEVPGNKLEVYSAVSSDGVEWTPENGARREFTVFPDAVKLTDGKYRMYFQNGGVIKSAISSDGLSWKDENGVRIDTKNSEGLIFQNVAGPTTIMDGNKYIMAYSGSISGKYKDAPNNYMTVLMWATSSDGLNFEVQGLALDPRNDKFYGFADTPDLIKWSDGTIKMFFWGYFGIYESVFTGDGFTEPVMVYEAKKENAMQRFPSSPPGDPTLGKVGDKWFMYYGQHTKGIFYASLE